MKQYKRWSTIAGFENLDGLRDGRILKFLDIILRDSLRTKHEATQRRVGMHKALVNCAEDGEVAIVYSGMDCDCSQYSGHYTITQATAKGVDEAMDRIYSGADGPIYSFEIVKPTEAQDIEPTSRDLALEAFEDGHQHIVYPGQ